MLTDKKSEIIVIPHICGEFAKLTEIYKDNFLNNSENKNLLIFLIGKVFDSEKNFSEINHLLKLQHIKFIVMDESEVGVIFKHKLGFSHFDYSPNVIFLGRSGVYVHNQIRIFYLNGFEKFKFLSKSNDFRYTSCFYSRKDVDNLCEMYEEEESGYTDILLMNTIPALFFDRIIDDVDFCQGIHLKRDQAIEMEIKVSVCANMVLKRIMPQLLITSASDFSYDKFYSAKNKNSTRMINLPYFFNTEDKEVFKVAVKPMEDGVSQCEEGDNRLIRKQNTISFPESESNMEEVVISLTRRRIQRRVYCRFCFDSPIRNKELLFNATANFYLAYSSEPLNKYHFQILPKKHLKNFVELEEARLKEFVGIIKKVTQIIQKNHLEFIIFERNLPHQVDDEVNHMAINILGIDRKHLLKTFELIHNELNANNIEFQEFQPEVSITKQVEKGFHYFYIDAPMGAKYVKTITRKKFLINLTKDESSLSENFRVDWPKVIIYKLLEKEDNSNTNEVNLEVVKEEVMNYFN